MRSHSSDRASYPPWERWRERFVFSITLKYPSFTSHIQVSKFFQSCFKICQHSQIPSEYLINFSIFLQSLYVRAQHFPECFISECFVTAHSNNTRIMEVWDCPRQFLLLAPCSCRPITKLSILSPAPENKSKKQNVLKVQKDDHH